MLHATTVMTTDTRTIIIVVVALPKKIKYIINYNTAYTVEI